ncbi:hypothetical protein [Ramlibacter sp. 2FC]|nr:hypothetical protein [Ramlibacter sp. 2FC]
MANAIRFHHTGGPQEPTWEPLAAARAHRDLEARKTTASSIFMI